MNLKQQVEYFVRNAIQDVFEILPESVEIQFTRREFEGEYTLVVFPLIRSLKGKPEDIATKIGDHLLAQKQIVAFNVVKGFLNMSLDSALFLNNVVNYATDKSYGFTQVTPTSRTVMVEYSSPNTNKPLHLGHVRNNLLGFSVAKIIQAAGNNVIKTQIINDRGIHICKSMVAWQKFGNGETPASTGLKGDHLVGKYYVEFDKNYRLEIKELMEQGLSEDDAKKQAPLFVEAQQMLRQWEAQEPAVIELWKTMNSWVYDGFAKTYKRLGVEFDEYLYESNTYILGKDIVDEGLANGVFFKKEDGSVWIDLTEDGLDQKLVLRSDGTSVYMTQDLGTAVERFKNNATLEELIYVVGNEQDYHFKVLFLILAKLGYTWAESLHHLSYGMVDLPNGKMKSREGTVVDADELMEEIYQTAKTISEELGKLEAYDDAEKAELYEKIGMGALKYYILKVDPKKRILFDPQESVDFNGNTGPFIQYTYARIQSLVRKQAPTAFAIEQIVLNEAEKEMIRALNDFQPTIKKAADELSPALIANYAYELVKLFNSFYQNNPILKGDDEDVKNFRLYLSQWVANTIESSLDLLGIGVPERM